MRVAYLDCHGGLAGDMLLAALLDAGASEDAVRAALAGLGLSGWRLELHQVQRAGLRALRAVVEIGDAQPVRPYGEVRASIERAALEDGVKRRALRVFEELARAEARVHGRADLEAVHLHEAGATDALIDVVGVCAALADLAVEELVCSPLPLGRGTVRGAHGELPLPAPAVLELLAGAPVTGAGEGETVTPTGAALARALADSFGDPPDMTLLATGYGAGARDTARPNVVRVLLGEAGAQRRAASALLVEANLDDMSPELLPEVIARLLAAGAQDAWVTPVVMKKGRPAFTLSALCTPAEHERVLDVIYAETTTFGTRTTAVAKDELERSWAEVGVAGCTVRVKLARRGGAVITAAPEHDDALAAARATGLPLKEVYRLALQALQEAGL